MKTMTKEKLGRVKPTFVPKAPEALEKLDIPESLVEDLVLRRLYTNGASSIKYLSNVLKLSFPVIQAVFERLRRQQLFEVTGLQGNDYTFTLSGGGREHAAKRFDISTKRPS